MYFQPLHWYYPGSREIGLLFKRTTRTVNSDLLKKEVESRIDGVWPNF